MTKPPDGPAPDLSGLDARDPAMYEWLLSDHPWARAERIRRAAATADFELGNAAAVRDWTARIDGLDLDTRYPSNPTIAENLRGLAEIMRPLADEQQLRAQLDTAAPDDVLIQDLRRRWETSRRAAGDDYTYPSHLIGPGATAYPPPPTAGSSAAAGTDQDGTGEDGIDEDGARADHDQTDRTARRCRVQA